MVFPQLLGGLDRRIITPSMKFNESLVRSLSRRGAIIQ